MNADRHIVTEEITWEGITIEVAYEAVWLGIGAEYQTAHLELHVLHPLKAILPVTDTGYRSHFIQRDWVEKAGGPVAFVLGWLNEEARSPLWRQKQATDRQLSLF